MTDAAAPARAVPASAELRVPRPRWLRRYTAALVAIDAAAMTVATLTAKISWLGIDPQALEIRGARIPYVALVLVTVPTWIVLLALAGAYDLGPFGGSPGAWTRVVRAGAQLLAVVAVAYYIAHLATLGRAVLAGTIPLAVMLTLAMRAAAGRSLGALRRRGRARRRAMLLGSRRSIDAFVHQLAGAPASAIDVVASQAINGAPPHPLAVSGALARAGAETLIVTGGLAQGRLRDLAWVLEGTGVEVLVSPTPADVEDLRSEIRPVAGLPLLYLDR